jgi:hypothetical protein
MICQDGGGYIPTLYNEVQLEYFPNEHPIRRNPFGIRGCWPAFIGG